MRNTLRPNESFGGFTDLCKRSESGSIYESGKIFKSKPSLERTLYQGPEKKSIPLQLSRPTCTETRTLHDIVLLTLL